MSGGSGDTGNSLVARFPHRFVWLGMLVYATGPLTIAASDVDGATFSVLRLMVGVALTGLLAARWHARPRHVSRAMTLRTAVFWTLLGGISFGVHQVALTLAVKQTSVADVAVMSAVAPIMVALLALPLLGERPTKRFLAWGPVAIIGSAVVAYQGSAGPQGSPFGMLLAVTNVIFFAMFFLCSKLATARIGVWVFLFGVMITALPMAAGIHLVTGQPVGAPSLRDALLILAMAVGPGALGHFLMTAPLQYVPAILPPVVRLLQPFVSGGLAWLLLAQAFTPAHMAGGVLTAVGVLGSLRGRPPPTGEAPQA